MKKRTLLSWSSGKDSAWALYVLRQRPDVDVVGLFCTVNQEFDRVAMHAVRRELTHLQARSSGLAIHIIEIPHPCSNAHYEACMAEFIERVKAQRIEYFAFGDLFLEDVRSYREKNLSGTGITPLFPLWGIPTQALSHEMINAGLRARITCVDPKSMSPHFVGREYNEAFLKELPENVDPCGEYGEFHSFAFAGPMFQEPINICVGKVIERDGFVFADLIPVG